MAIDSDLNQYIGPNSAAQVAFGRIQRILSPAGRARVLEQDATGDGEERPVKTRMPARRLTLAEKVEVLERYDDPSPAGRKSQRELALKFQVSQIHPCRTR